MSADYSKRRRSSFRITLFSALFAIIFHIARCFGLLQVVLVLPEVICIVATLLFGLRYWKLVLSTRR